MHIISFKNKKRVLLSSYSIQNSLNFKYSNSISLFSKSNIFTNKLNNTVSVNFNPNNTRVLYVDRITSNYSKNKLFQYYSISSVILYL